MLYIGCQGNQRNVGLSSDVVKFLSTLPHFSGVNVTTDNTEQQKKIYRMYLRVFQLFLANLGALISNLKPDFFYHV